MLPIQHLPGTTHVLFLLCQSANWVVEEVYRTGFKHDLSAPSVEHEEAKVPQSLVREKQYELKSQQDKKKKKIPAQKLRYP